MDTTLVDKIGVNFFECILVLANNHRRPIDVKQQIVFVLYIERAQSVFFQSQIDARIEVVFIIEKNHNSSFGVVQWIRYGRQTKKANTG